MRKRNVALIVVLAAVLIIVSCKGTISTFVPLSNIVDVGQNEDIVYLASARLLIPLFSFVDEDQDLKDKVSYWFRGAQNIQFDNSGESTYLTADIKIPIYNYLNYNFDNTYDLLALVVDQYYGELYFGFSLSDFILDEINDYLLYNFFTSISFDEWKITINLYNDYKEDQSVELYGVYVDGKPNLHGKSYTLKSDEYVEVELSELVKDVALQEGDLFFGFLPL